MLLVDNFKNEDFLKQNCKVGRSYPVCESGKLCNPQSEFDMIESCKNCNKQL